MIERYSRYALKPLTTQQRALVAAVVLRDYGHKDGGDRRSEVFQCIQKKLDTLNRDEVLNQLETSLSSYDRARRILAPGVPALVPAVVQGKVSLRAASQTGV